MSTLNIPVELKARPNWVVWKYETRDGKETKVPYDAKSNGGHVYAKSNDPTTWTTFEQASDAADVLNGNDYDGIGFELGGTSTVGIDFDHAVNTDGVVDPYVLAILASLGNPYTEVSPSGNGLHAFVECDALPEGKRKLSKDHDGIEIYHGREGGRYFTITGDKNLGEGVPKIEDISLPYLLITQNKTKDKKFRNFKALWLGDTSFFDGDDSSADFALLRMLATLTQNDAAKMEKYFSASALGQRDKWRDREDYRQRSIKAAILSQPNESNIQSSKHTLMFTIPTGPLGSERDYVMAPAAGESDGWFPLGDVSLIAGPSGTGKTTWAYQFLMAQQSKVPFYGHETFGRSFITLGADRGENAHKRTMARMHLRTESIPFKPVHIDVFDFDAVQVIVNQIESIILSGSSCPEIVFVEGLDMMVTKVSDIACVSSFLKHLQIVASHFHVALIGSVGSPKNKEGSGYTATRDNILGSVAWGRNSETVALFQFPKKKNKGRRELTVELRNGPREEFTLQFVDGLLEIESYSHEDENEASESEKDSIRFDWYQTQAQLAKNDPTKKWFTIVDLESALRLPHSTADRQVKNDRLKKYLTKKSDREKLGQFRWNESKANPKYVEQQAQEDVAQLEVF
jgi:hypothetical protein